MRENPPDNPSDLEYSEDQRRHLDFIQGVVSRLAGNQFLVKGWVLTVSVAVLGYAATHRAIAVALLGIAVVLGFAGLDMYFLRQERLFRHIWKDAVDRVIEPYSMDPRSHLHEVKYFRASTDENKHRRRAVAFSPPIVGLYGMLILITAIVAIGIGVSDSKQHHSTPTTPQPTRSSAESHQPR